MSCNYHNLDFQAQFTLKWYFLPSLLHLPCKKLVYLDPDQMRKFFTFHDLQIYTFAQYFLPNHLDHLLHELLAQHLLLQFPDSQLQPMVLVYIWNSKRRETTKLSTCQCLEIIVFVDFKQDSHIMLQGYFAYIDMNIHRKHWIHNIVGVVCDYQNIWDKI